MQTKQVRVGRGRGMGRFYQEAVLCAAIRNADVFYGKEHLRLTSVVDRIVWSGL